MSLGTYLPFLFSAAPQQCSRQQKKIPARYRGPLGFLITSSFCFTNTSNWLLHTDSWLAHFLLLTKMFSLLLKHPQPSLNTPASGSLLAVYHSNLLRRSALLCRDLRNTSQHYISRPASSYKRKMVRYCLTTLTTVCYKLPSRQTLSFKGIQPF